MARALRQGRLFEAADLVPHVPTVAEQIADARAYVAHVLARRICVVCGGDERLVFHHRVVASTNVTIARLVQAGVSRARLAEEVLRCEVICRRCLLGRTYGRPQMLWVWTRGSVGVVAKGRSTTGCAAKTLHGALKRKTG